MASEWKEVAAQLAQLGLPILGRALGGQIPIIGGLFGKEAGGMIGSTIASAIAMALGVDATPGAISEAIEGGNTTEVVARLQTIEAEAAARWPALAEIAKVETSGEIEVAKINAESSARVAGEIATNGFWLSLYRSILMYAATFNLIVFGVVFFWALLIDQAMWQRLVDGRDLIAWWIGGNVSILGFHFYTRGKEREAAVTRTPPLSPVGNTVAAVTGKKR